HRQGQTPTAGNDRRQQQIRRVGSEQEDRSGRRLLQYLQQGVGGNDVHSMGGINHRHSPAATVGSGRKPARQRSDLFHADFARRRLLGRSEEHTSELQSREKIV